MNEFPVFEYDSKNDRELGSLDPEKMYAIALDKNTPAHLQQEIAQKFDRDFLYSLLAHPDLPGGMLVSICRDSYITEMRVEAVIHQNFPEKELTDILTSSALLDHDFCEEIASYSYIPNRVAELFLHHENWVVRAAFAENTSLCAMHTALMNDPSPKVVVSLAQNLFLSVPQMLELIAAGNKRAIIELTENPETPTSLLDFLSCSAIGKYVQKAAKTAKKNRERERHQDTENEGNNVTRI